MDLIQAWKVTFLPSYSSGVPRQSSLADGAMSGFDGGGLGVADEVDTGFLDEWGKGWYGLAHRGAGLEMVGGLQ